MEKIKKYEKDNLDYFDADDLEYEKKISIWSKLEENASSEVALPDEILKDIRTLNSYFPKTSWIDKDNQNHFRNLANKLNNWKRSARIPKGSEWETKINEMITDIRTLGKNSKDLTRLHNKYHDFNEMSNLQGEIITKEQIITQNKNIISNNIKEIKDFNTEKDNIKQKGEALKFKEEFK